MDTISTKFNLQTIIANFTIYINSDGCHVVIICNFYNIMINTLYLIVFITWKNKFIFFNVVLYLLVDFFFYIILWFCSMMWLTALIILFFSFFSFFTSGIVSISWFFWSLHWIYNWKKIIISLIFSWTYYLNVRNINSILNI